MNVILLLLINRICCPGDIGGGFARMISAVDFVQMISAVFFCPGDIGGGFYPGNYVLECYSVHRTVGPLIQC